MFSSGALLYWLVLLIIFIALSLWIYIFAVRHNFKIKWYYASLISLIIFIFAYIFKNFLTTLFEYEMQAVWLFMIIIGVPVVIGIFWAWKKIKKKV